MNVMCTTALAAAGALCLVTTATAQPAPSADSVGEMLNDFVIDYRSDAMARPLTFGVEVRDADTPRWHVVVGEAGTVTLHEGFPETPSAFFTTDLETLERIHAGELASLTAMGKAFSTDFAPLDLDVMEGFQPGATTFPDLIAAAFHFWTRGFPERVQFGDLAATRRIHGGNATLFYYQEGFRSGFFSIQPGDRVNEDEDSQTNPFPSLFIVTVGPVNARIGGEECVINAGETIFIGPGVSHEFWIDDDADHHAEGFILMFGDGA